MVLFFLIVILVLRDLGLCSFALSPSIWPRGLCCRLWSLGRVLRGGRHFWRRSWGLRLFLLLGGIPPHNFRRGHPPCIIYFSPGLHSAAVKSAWLCLLLVLRHILSSLVSFLVALALWRTLSLAILAPLSFALSPM